MAKISDILINTVLGTEAKFVIYQNGNKVCYVPKVSNFFVEKRYL